MDWKKVLGVLPAGLDIVGKVVGGPIGAVADMGGTMLARALGVDADPDSVTAAIQTDPAKALELIKAQLEHDKDMQALATQQTIALAAEETKRYELQLGGVADARASQVSLLNAGAGHNYRADVMVYGMLTLLAAMSLALLFMEIPKASEQLVYTIITGVLLIVKDAFGFEFGASQPDRSGDQRSIITALKARVGL